MGKLKRLFLTCLSREGLDYEFSDLVGGCVICLHLQVMEIRGALNAILELRAYKVSSGDFRGLLIDKVCIHSYS